MVKLLAIETTGLRGSVALHAEGRLVLGRELDPAGGRSAATLVPAIKDSLAEAGWRAADLTGIAVVTGPGSFTGLRVGVTTARVLAYTLGQPIVGIDALEVLAAASEAAGRVVSAAIDAQRGDVACARFYVDGERVRPVRLDAGFQVVRVADWLASGNGASGAGIDLWENNTDRKTGNLSELFFQKVQKSLQEGYLYSSPVLDRLRLTRAEEEERGLIAPERRQVQARVVARLAECRFLSGEADDVWTLLPVYSRRSAAEEKALMQEGNDSGKVDLA
ncbi:MAG: tRNA (adenosine(37)-N6)-threonylcarbamoyltransferase complex dimerization subunit type 1 TsaB [Planctomycetia bacterium]|nr:tRNA (adenosine(37)-N6)-threonylcarbamoyltransferase complex dimerization subunit type 1 TsaB [Planctomycetia bacterium]